MLPYYRPVLKSARVKLMKEMITHTDLDMKACSFDREIPNASLLI